MLDLDQVAVGPGPFADGHQDRAEHVVPGRDHAEGGECLADHLPHAEHVEAHRGAPEAPRRRVRVTQRERVPTTMSRGAASSVAAPSGMGTGA